MGDNEGDVATIGASQTMTPECLDLVWPGEVGSFLPCYSSTNASSEEGLWCSSASAKPSIKADNTI